MTGARILIVDDDAQVLGLYMKVLVGRGYTVTGTTSGVDALAAGADGRFDLAIVDLSMPDIDGFEVLKTLHRESPSLKILVMSGAMQGLLLQSAHLFGATATLNKPASPEVMIGVVEGLVQSHTSAAGG